MSKSKRTNRKRAFKEATPGRTSQPSESPVGRNPKRFLLRWAGVVLLIALGCYVWLEYMDDGANRDQNNAAHSQVVEENSSSLENLSAEDLEKLLEIPSIDSVEPSLASLDVDQLANQVEQAIQARKRDFPNEAQSEHLDGLFQLRLKRTKLAEPRLRRCVELAPENQQMRMDLADLLSQQGRDEEALDVLVSCKTSAPKQIEFLWRLGDSQLRFGQLDEAEETLRVAIQSFPGQAPFWVQLALVQTQQGNLEGAMSSLRKSIELDPNEPEAWLLLNKVCVILKQTAEAGDALTRWKKLQDNADGARPKKPFETQHPEEMRKVLGSAFRSLGNLCRTTNDNDRANVMYESAFGVDPKDPTTLADWASLMRRMGNFEKVAELNCLLLRVNPLDAASYQNLANVSMELNRPQRAEAALRLACLRMPKNGSCHLLLARFLLLANKVREALKPANEAFSILQNSESVEVLTRAKTLLPLK